MARKGGNSGLACLVWDLAQMGPCALAPAQEGVSLLSCALYFPLLPLPGLRGSAWCPSRGRQLPITARASSGEGICEPPGKERSEPARGGGRVGERGSGPTGGEWPGSRWLGLGLLSRGKSRSCLGGSGELGKVRSGLELGAAPGYGPQYSGCLCVPPKAGSGVGFTPAGGPAGARLEPGRHWPGGAADPQAATAGGCFSSWGTRLVTKAPCGCRFHPLPSLLPCGEVRSSLDFGFQSFGEVW